MGRSSRYYHQCRCDPPGLPLPPLPAPPNYLDDLDDPDDLEIECRICGRPIGKGYGYGYGYGGGGGRTSTVAGTSSSPRSDAPPGKPVESTIPEVPSLPDEFSADKTAQRRSSVHGGEFSQLASNPTGSGVSPPSHPPPMESDLAPQNGSAQLSTASLRASCALSLEEVVAEIEPVTWIGRLAPSLALVFQAAQRSRVNRSQWKLLQGRCAMVVRIACAHITSSDRHNSSEMETALDALRKSFETISEIAQSNAETDLAEEFSQFEAISVNIEHLFETLDPCLAPFSCAPEIARSQWANEFHIVREQEFAGLTRIRQKLLDENEEAKRSQVNQAKATSRRVESLWSKGMSAQEMFECLKRHGCQDLTERVDMTAILSRPVATGAYGDIFKGTLDDGTDIAIKVWSFRRAEQAPHKCLKGAMRELYNWSKADHKNIQKLLGVVMFKSRLGMVSRWMGNGNLQDYIRKYQPEDRYQLCMQVAEAVQHLHREKMVHGDLKACNFLVSSDSVVKLTDFDHSIISCHSIVFSQTTTMGGGTMRWMAPELVMDEGEVELRSTQADVYALGMTMLEIITGAVPYVECQGDRQVFCKLLDKILPERKEPFQDMRGDRMWELLVQCWDHDPALRPSADMVVESLQSLIPVTTLPNDGA